MIWRTTSTFRCPAPRLPHDMAFTENYVILNDFPLFWDPDLLAHDVHLPRFLPRPCRSRFAVLPRRGWHRRHPLVRGRPEPSVLHFTNAYEDGDENCARWILRRCAAAD